MKIAIFGDSFSGGEVPSRENPEQQNSWVRLLREHYDITNYSQSGTALANSYLEFIQHHTDFDTIIFFVTNVHRCAVYSLPLGHVHYDSSYIGLQTQDTNLEFEENIKQNLEKLKYVWRIDPLRYTVDEEWNAVNLLYYYAMISHVKLLRPDVKLVHAFATFTNRNMMSISHLDVKSCRSSIPPYRFLKYSDCYETADRVHHMSKQQNIEVAEYMHLWLKGKLDFNDTLGNNVEKYYTKSKTLEIAGLALR